MSDKYGPNTAAVEAYLAPLPTVASKQWDAARTLTSAQIERAHSAWDVAWDAAMNSSRFEESVAAYYAAHRSAWNEAWHCALDAAQAAVALVVRDLIAPEVFDSLVASVRAAGIDFGTTVDAIPTMKEIPE